MMIPALAGDEDGRVADVFELEAATEVPHGSSYILSYPHLLSYFAAKSTFDSTDLVRGAHIVYGWMPTILEFYVKPQNIDLDTGAQLLTRAKSAGHLSDDELSSLVAIINNSLVGTSKLLHFVAPESFAIWDSKVCRFFCRRKPHSYVVQRVANYRRYHHALARIRQDSRFPAFHESVNRKVGYPVSTLRAIELVMHLNAA